MSAHINGSFSNKPKHTSKSNRTPKLYKDVKFVLKELAQKKALKTILGTLRHQGSINKVTLLVTNIVKNHNILKAVIEESKILEFEPRLDKDLAIIFLYELLFGRTHFNNALCTAYSTLLKHKEKLLKAYENIKNNFSNSQTVVLPRYARVNTLRISVEEVVSQLVQDGFIQINLGQISFKKYMKILKKLEENEFIIDAHFPDVLVFPSRVKLHDYFLVTEGYIFLQDKSSYLSVLALSPPKDSTVLDACAAPGMKTVHLAAVMENTGKIFAADVNKERFASLESFVKLAGAECCTLKCLDFLDVSPTEGSQALAEYILLDPPCSGSGMARRLGFEDHESEDYKERLKKLSNFQSQLLKHCFKFPKVKRIVYSTCSINEEENEEVIAEMMKHAENHFVLKPCIPGWPVRGKSAYDFGSLCLRTSPEETLTNGFFVAIFERKESLE